MTTAVEIKSPSSEPLTLDEARKALERQTNGTFAVDCTWDGEKGVSVELILTGKGPRDPHEQGKVRAATQRIEALDLTATATQVVIAQTLPHRPEIIEVLGDGDLYYQLRYISTTHITTPRSGESWMDHYNQTRINQREALLEEMDALIKADTGEWNGITMRFLQGEDLPSLTFFATNSAVLEEVQTEIDANHTEVLEFPESSEHHGIQIKEKLATPDWLQP